MWVGRGRGKADIRPFFELLSPQGRSQITAVAMDMNAGYVEEVRSQCPQAEIVYDLFHVVARYGHEVFDRVRVDEANRLRQDPKGRQIVKGSRWLLLRNYRNNDKREDRVRLQELLSANRSLAKVHILSADGPPLREIVGALTMHTFLCLRPIHRAFHCPNPYSPCAAKACSIGCTTASTSLPGRFRGSLRFDARSSRF